MVYALNQPKDPSLYANQCYLEDESCLIELEHSDFKLAVDQYPVQLEEEISLNLRHSTDLVFEKAWLEGTNMYMGKTPLMINSSDVEGESVLHDASLFIGACSEPEMRWRIVIDLSDVSTGQSHRLSVFFQTQR